MCEEVMPQTVLRASSTLEGGVTRG